MSGDWLTIPRMALPVGFIRLVCRTRYDGLGCYPLPMRRTFDPFQLLLASMAGWLGQQRRRLAAKAKMPGRRILREVATMVTPETLLAWRRKLIAQKYDGSGNRGLGGPRIRYKVEGWGVRRATEDRDGGYGRIQGAFADLGREVARGTIANIFKKHRWGSDGRQTFLQRMNLVRSSFWTVGHVTTVRRVPESVLLILAAIRVFVRGRSDTAPAATELLRLRMRVEQGLAVELLDSRPCDKALLLKIGGLG